MVMHVLFVAHWKSPEQCDRLHRVKPLWDCVCGVWERTLWVGRPLRYSFLVHSGLDDDSRKWQSTRCALPISRESFEMLSVWSTACRNAVGHTQVVKLRCSRQLADICMEMVVVR
jgi:hypothetical protein